MPPRGRLGRLSGSARGASGATRGRRSGRTTPRPGRGVTPALQPTSAAVVQVRDDVGRRRRGYVLGGPGGDLLLVERGHRRFECPASRSRRYLAIAPSRSRPSASRFGSRQSEAGPTYRPMIREASSNSACVISPRARRLRRIFWESPRTPIIRSATARIAADPHVHPDGQQADYDFRRTDLGHLYS